MGNRSYLYVFCGALYPLAFAAFVIGLGCPVWIYRTDFNINTGLWQRCNITFENCRTLEFDDIEWMIGVRIIELIALVLLCLAVCTIVYENCNTNFRGRTLLERLSTGILCIVGGLSGLAGIITYAVKQKNAGDLDLSDLGWAWALVTAGSGLAVLLGIGFCVSGGFLEGYKKDKDPTRMNGRPHVTSNEENYELNAYTNKAASYDEYGRPPKDNLPGYAVYNGQVAQRTVNQSEYPMYFSRQQTGLPYNTAQVLPPFGAPTHQGMVKNSPYEYSSRASDGYVDPNFDLSEGYKLPRPRSAQPSDVTAFESPFYASATTSYRPYAQQPGDAPARHGTRSQDMYLHTRPESGQRTGFQQDDRFTGGRF